MKALSYQIHLLSPLLATQLSAGEENSSKSFNYIPGSMLRGALINLYLRERRAQKQGTYDPALDPVCRRLFFDGTNCYLNAYPVDNNFYRTIPKPLSWYMKKEELEDDNGTVYDLALEEVENLKPCPGCFYSLDGDIAYLVKTSSSLSMHNASAGRMVRLKDRSTVYYYEAIAAGQVFGAAVVSKNVSDLNLLKSWMENRQIAIGGSKSAGYGRVVFRETRIHDAWNECEQQGAQRKGELVLTLLSDLIFRNKNGHYTTDLDEILGCKHERAYQSTKIVGGFNRKWGLPLVQVPAVQAGSVFVYRAGDIDQGALEQYLAEGIGDRRVEGFGRIAINLNRHNILSKFACDKPNLLRDDKLPLSGESTELAGRLAVRRLKKMLDGRLLEAIDRLDIIHFPPEKSQLNRLREVAKQALRQDQPEIITNYLNDMGETGARQFKRARITGNRRLSTWLMEDIKGEKIWKDYLGLEQKPGIVSVAGVSAEITKEIKLEYTVRLLEAVLKKTVKKLQEESVL